MLPPQVFEVPIEGEVTIRYVVNRDGRRLTRVTRYVSGHGPFLVSNDSRPLLTWQVLAPRAALLAFGALGFIGGLYVLARVGRSMEAWASGHSGAWWHVLSAAATLSAFMATMLLPSAAVVVVFLWRARRERRSTAIPPRAP